MVNDAIGRKWQLGTIQVDYNLPERFQLDSLAPTTSVTARL
jgi:threonyl-tRNA synthetase